MTADWVEERLEEFQNDDPDYRLVEADIEYEESYAEEHIPGAENISWKNNVRDDGTFKDRDELEDGYEEYDVEGDSEVVTYCCIGERSSITWFTLHDLLGFDDVRNYDGSWTEWGNMIRTPIRVVTDEPATLATEG